MPDSKQQMAELVVALQKGDGKAFEKLYNMTADTARFTALKITKNKEDAEDVVQNVYMKLIDKIKKLDKPESFNSWFNMIVANEAKDFMRKQKPEFFTDNVIHGSDDGDEEFSVFDNIEDETEEFTPGAGIEKEELQQAVMNLIEELDDEKRTAILLYFYNNMTTKQISESLGISESTIKSRLVAAKKELAKSVTALEKKNGKLLGVAPMSLVVWALKAASASVGSSFAASGATAATFTAITAGSAAASAGAGTTAAAGSGIAAKIIAGIVAAGIVTGGTIAVTKAVKDRKESAGQNETTYSQSVTENVAEETTTDVFDVTYNAEDMPDDKNVDTIIEYGEAKYGVDYASEGFAVRSEDGVEIDQARPVLNRQNYSATYDDLLPAAKENQTTYSKNINNTVSDINSERTSSGLGTLTVDPTLSEQASVRAEEIAWSAKNSPIRPDGSSYTSLFDRNGYSSGSRGEIRVFNSSSYDNAIKSVLSDSAVLSADAQKIGVGVAKNPENDKLVYIVHLYSAKDNAFDESADASDVINDTRNDAIDSVINQNLETVQELQNFEDRVSDIPVIGDILTYDFHNDWFFKGLSDFTDRMSDLKERAGE